MKIIHRIYHDWNKEQVKLLASFGIKVETGTDRFDMEDGETFRQLEHYLDKWGAHKYAGTIYDKKDIDGSKLLVYIGVWENGYPQPEEVDEYKKLTYNIENYCRACGIGAVQKAPFRIKKEPKWGTKKMFELTWVMDEIFINKDLYETYFKGLGLEYWPVLLYKKDTVIENTVQLKIPIIDTPLLLQNQPFEVCETCGRRKYNPQIKGYFPSFERDMPKSFQMFKSSEYFGSGGAADRRMFITKEVYDSLRGLNIKPTVWPVR